MFLILIANYKFAEIGNAYPKQYIQNNYDDQPNRFELFLPIKAMLSALQNITKSSRIRNLVTQTIKKKIVCTKCHI